MNTPRDSIFIGTAGWNIPAQLKAHFPEDGSHLQRYAQVLNCVEINSAFYREHKHETYVKWASSVPSHFRFSVKLSRYFTQEKKLTETGSRLQEVLDGISGLGEKWGALLVQLPPRLEFDAVVAERFISDLKKRVAHIQIIWEPRHRSWSSAAAMSLLTEYEISKVRADPEPCPISKKLRRQLGTRYYRLHGSPEIYKSRYSEAFLTRIATRLLRDYSRGSPVWCIFDNTTFGFATENALELRVRIDNQ